MLIAWAAGCSYQVILELSTRSSTFTSKTRLNIKFCNLYWRENAK